MDKLNRHNNDSEIKSGQSLRSLPEILSRPVAFDLQSLDVFCLQVGELLRIDKGAAKRFVKSALWNLSGNLESSLL